MSDSRKKHAVPARQSAAKILPDDYKCIICNDDVGESPQPVFDEVGKELELQKLLLQCFNVTVVEKKNEVQSLCEACLNDLIETVDIQQKEVEDEEANRSLHPGTSKDPYGSDADELEYSLDKLESALLNSEVEDDEDVYDFEMLEEDEETITPDNVDVEPKEEVNTDLECEDDEIYENVDYLETVTDYDFRAFKESCTNIRYNDLDFPAELCCKICDEYFTKHIDLMEHQQLHCTDDGFYQCCLCDGSVETFEHLSDLAYHLVYKHYDLSKILLYLQCSVCMKRFSNFLVFNKHSCNDSKSLSRSLKQCEQCGEDFQSNKRYRFHLQFHLDNHRPRGCMICDKMFMNDSHLYEHVHYEHEEDIGLTCCRCDVTFTNVENLKAHEKVHELVRSYKCQLCPRSYLYNQQLKDHVLAHHTKKKPFQCKICGKVVNKLSVLNKHMTFHEKPEEKQIMCCSICGIVEETAEEIDFHIKNLHEDRIAEAEILLITLDIAYSCEFCEDAYRSVERLCEHREKHSKDRFYCNMCPLEYDEYKKLKTHKLTHVNYVDKSKTFPVMRHYVCDKANCRATYSQWTTLRSHKRVKHDNPSSNVCTTCDIVFKSADSCKEHIQNVHEGAVHRCPFCEKNFITKMAMSVHVARKHNTPRVQCDQCQMEFTGQQFLEKHIQTTHCPVECTQCGKVFKNGKNLVVHERAVHNKEKRYFCSYCSKGYYNQCDALEHEEQVHRKIKRYQCPMCDYTSVYKQTLTIHIRGHTKEMPYKCKICPKAFRRSYGLSLHMKRHYDIRNFVCPYEGCGSAYPNQGILNSHLKKKHPNGENNISRKRRTMGLTDLVPQEEILPDPKPPAPKKSRRRYDVPLTNVFIDDDDGLDDGVIGEPQSNVHVKHESLPEAQVEGLDSDPDNPVAYILGTNGSIEQAVIVQYNEMDHDYVGKTNDKIIYGDVIEEYVVE